MGSEAVTTSTASAGPKTQSRPQHGQHQQEQQGFDQCHAQLGLQARADFGERQRNAHQQRASGPSA